MVQLQHSRSSCDPWVAPSIVFVLQPLFYRALTVYLCLMGMGQPRLQAPRSFQGISNTFKGPSSESVF